MTALGLEFPAHMERMTLKEDKPPAIFPTRCAGMKKGDESFNGTRRPDWDKEIGRPGDSPKGTPARQDQFTAASRTSLS